MNITTEIVKNLLYTFVSPEYDDIVYYDVILRQNADGKTGVGIDVVMKQKIYINKTEEYSIERSIRDVMKYISPAFTMVEFYATNNY